MGEKYGYNGFFSVVTCCDLLSGRMGEKYGYNGFFSVVTCCDRIYCPFYLIYLAVGHNETSFFLKSIKII